MSDAIHYHAAAGGMYWARCGARVGGLTFLLANVTCADCLQMLEPKPVPSDLLTDLVLLLSEFTTRAEYQVLDEEGTADWVTVHDHFHFDNHFFPDLTALIDKHAGKKVLWDKASQDPTGLG